MSTLITTPPKGEKIREINSLALSELLKEGYCVPVIPSSYFPSKRGGYVYVSDDAAVRIAEFAERIKTAATQDGYDYSAAITEGCFMLWLHANDKAKNKELFFRYKSYPAVELSIAISCLRLP